MTDPDSDDAYDDEKDNLTPRQRALLRKWQRRCVFETEFSKLPTKEEENTEDE